MPSEENGGPADARAFFSKSQLRRRLSFFSAALFSLALSPAQPSGTREGRGRTAAHHASREVLVLLEHGVSRPRDMLRAQRLEDLSVLQEQVPQELQDETQSPQGEVDQGVPRAAR
jgi:hypothetical protein